MKKLIVVVVTAGLLLSACSESDGVEVSEDEKLIADFADSIKKGSESGMDIRMVPLSAETSTCISESSIPLMDKELLAQKINSGAFYQIDDLALYDGNEENLAKAELERNLCFTDEEFVASIEKQFQSNFEINGSCVAEKLVSGLNYVDIVENSDDEGVTELTEIVIECANPTIDSLSEDGLGAVEGVVISE